MIAVRYHGAVYVQRVLFDELLAPETHAGRWVDARFKTPERLASPDDDRRQKRADFIHKKLLAAIGQVVAENFPLGQKRPTGMYMPAKRGVGIWPDGLRDE